MAREDIQSMSGPDKAALLMLAVGEDNAARLFGLMEDDEIRELFEKQSSEFTKRMTTVVRRGQRSGEVRKGFSPEAVAAVISANFLADPGSGSHPRTWRHSRAVPRPVPPPTVATVSDGRVTLA